MKYKKFYRIIFQERYLLLLIFIVATLLRLKGLDWDQGYYLHPDERLYVNSSNIYLPSSIKEFFSPNSPLNPGMFYYGSFPLYIYKFVSLFFVEENFLILSRAVSAAFSILTIVFIYITGKTLFNKTVGLVSAFLFTFAPGSIQHAHFNTTESILIFLLCAITYFSIRLYKNFTYLNVIIIATLLGLSTATKITGITFGLLPFLVFIHLAFSKKFKLFFLGGIFFSLIFIGFTFLGAPYQVIDWPNFLREQQYMQDVILGKTKPPFTIIYENTLPYIYPLTKVMPFIFGFITFPIAILGFVFLLKKLLSDNKKSVILLSVIAFPVIYFLWSGIWYAKFSRYYLLLLPFICIWAAYFIYKLKNKLLSALILLLVAANGLLFTKVYHNPHTRLEASEWIYENISDSSTIAGEHWDDNLPIPILNFYKSFNLIQLNVYDNDTRNKIESISENLSNSDYFIISSRRVSHSIIENNKIYPYTSNFYKLLESEKLGFYKIKEFNNYPFIFNDNIADESFQSYDHPPVTIYKNISKYDKNLIYKLIIDEK